MKTLIAIPCMDNMPVGFVTSMMELNKPDASVCFKQNSLVYDARNILTQTAIDGNFDRVLWLDSDMAFRKDLLDMLGKDMDDTGADLVTGLCFKRILPTVPVIYKYIGDPHRDHNGRCVRSVEEYFDYPRNSIFPVDGCGFGGVLTKTSLLKRVWDDFGPPFYPYPWAGEDLSFCYRAKKIGAKMLCDSNAQLGHLGYIQYSEKMYTPERR